jgi:uncharacterized membrane protein (DUF4010 family)
MEQHIGEGLTAVLLGMLLGLERERSHPPEERFAGVRTFPIFALAGYLAGRLGQGGTPLALPALILGVSALVVAAYMHAAEKSRGATTEILAITTPLLGALVAAGEAPLAVALTVVTAFLLSLKAPLHRLAAAMTEDEIAAILKFAIVATVAFPLLPTEPIGPYGGVVPRHVGLVVVVICGVGLGGYLLVRLLGGRTGWALAGLLGGLVSSTAVTLSLSGKARADPGLVRPLAAGTILASTILYARSFVLLALFDRPLAFHLAPQLALLLAVGGLFAARELRSSEGASKADADAAVANPVELGRAVILGLVFAAILLASRAAQAEFGTAGLWGAAALGGLVDVDSVALANARLRQQGAASRGAAGGAFLLATLTNLAVKGGIALVVGGGGFARRALPPFAALAAATILLLLLA